MKIGLYLMGFKGLNSLKAIAEHPERQHIGSIAYVVSARDKNVQNDYFEDIKALSEVHLVPFFEKEAGQLEADFIFAISWRWIIKEHIEKLIVLHDSLLPRYRGFNPLVTALIEGDKEIGVTAIKANREFDKGNIISSKSKPITYPIKIKQAIAIISELYGHLMIDILELINTGSMQEKEQDETVASYSLWRNEDDYLVNWNQSAGKISRFIDALGYPYNGAFTYYDGEKIVINQSLVMNDLQIINRDAGKILFIEDNKPVIVCSEGLLQIEEAVYYKNKEKVNFNKLRVRLNDSL